MAKTRTKTFIKRGQEIKKENLKPNGIYAVHYVLPAEVAALYSTVQEQWGIVELDADKNILTTWNVNAYNAFDSSAILQRWVGGMTYFRSSQMERQFFEFHNSWVNDHVKYEKRLQDNTKQIVALEYEFRRTMSHPLHKIADKIIAFINKLKK